MTKFNVDIPDSIVEQAAGEKIKRLENDLKKSLNREKKLKAKLAEKEAEFKSAKEAISIINTSLEEILYLDGFENLRHGW